MQPNKKTRHIGENIAAIRHIKKLKQKALADRLNISQQALSKIENSTTVSRGTLLHIAEGLDVAVSTIENFDQLELRL